MSAKGKAKRRQALDRRRNLRLRVDRQSKIWAQIDELRRLWGRRSVSSVAGELIHLGLEVASKRGEYAHGPIPRRLRRLRRERMAEAGAALIRAAHTGNPFHEDWAAGLVLAAGLCDGAK